MMRWWVKLILGLLAIAAMCLLIVRMGVLTLDVLNNGESSTQSDPMFAAEEPTQAPLSELDEGNYVAQDNSANWVQDVHTPVDQNAQELEDEERSKSE